ncbi:MAG TPA: UvrD-helicase domain-containing protein [Clostridia bacterium]|nr:UvrD-helicase domain-containing protein [Clostridia bacterium]
MREIIALYQKMRTSGKSLADLKERNLSAEQNFNLVIDEQIRVLDGLAENLSQVKQEEKLPANTLSKLEQFLALWEPLKIKLRKVSFEGELLFLEEEKKSLKGNVSSAVKGIFKEVAQALEDIEQAFVEERGNQIKNWLFILLERLDQAYCSLKEERNLLDFTDLELLTLQLFENYPDLAEECCNRFKYVLVDEVQDINPVQERLIYYLTCEGDTDHLLPARLFVVGDEKQSIYRFRGADVQVFTRLKEKIASQSGLCLDLDKNFRSRRQLIYFFNYFFSFLMGKPEDGKERADYEAVYKNVHFERDYANQAPLVELLVVKNGEGEELATADLRVKEAALMAERIEQMVKKKEKIILSGGELRPVNYGDIAILLRATTDIKIYEQELRKRNIPYLTTSGRGFYAKQEIQDILNFVHYLIDRQDEVKLTAILRSPFFGISDASLFWLKEQGSIQAGLERVEDLDCLEAEEKEKLLFARTCLAELSKIQHTLSLSQLMREIVARTGYEEVMLAQFFGRQAVANLHKLFALTEGLEQKNMGSLRELVRYLNRLAQRDPREGEAEVIEEGEDAVRIMTVHGAKGLEFPVVFLPDLARKPQGENGWFILGDDGDLGIKVAGSEGDYKPTIKYRQLKEEFDKQDRAENKRLLYVAFTRAEDYLVLGMSDSSPLKVPKDLGKIVSPLELQVELLARKNDWLSWLKIALAYIEGIGEPIEKNCIFTCGNKVEILVNCDLSASSQKEICSGGEEKKEKSIDHTFSLLSPIKIKNQAKTFSFSPTSLLTYFNCPRKFYFAHRICLPPLEGKEEEPTSISYLPARIRGNLVHRFCEIYEKEKDIELVLAECAREEGIGEDLFPLVKKQCLPLIKTYLQSSLYTEIRKAELVYSEWPFYYRQGSFQLQGKIDKLILSGRGIKIIDFKTDWLRPEDLEKKTEQYKLQLELYCLAAARILKQPISSALLYFVSADLTSVFYFSPEREKELATQFEEIAQKAAQDDFSQFPKAGNNCSACGYNLICSNC